MGFVIFDRSMDVFSFVFISSEIGESFRNYAYRIVCPIGSQSMIVPRSMEKEQPRNLPKICSIENSGNY